ncbi:hypothetical protein Ancab_005477, partial [Ancistrocladus abbreviatus]
GDGSGAGSNVVSPSSSPSLQPPSSKIAATHFRRPSKGCSSIPSRCGGCTQPKGFIFGGRSYGWEGGRGGRGRAA